MKSPHAVLEMLRARRDILANGRDSAGKFSVAVSEVLDELTRRAQVIADEYPEDERMTLRLIHEMPAVVEALAAITNTAAVLNDVISEGIDAVGARRDPVMRFVARIESEGFEVTDNWEVTDAHRWPPLGNTADPDLIVQREAEKTVRAERATAYHERLVRMAAAFESAQSEYTQRARTLIPTVLDG